MATTPDNIGQYHHYFNSGHYVRRYPRANRTVLRLIHSLLPACGRVLDYGCGSGRYLLPLRQHAAACIGFDVCTAALDSLRLQLDQLDDVTNLTLLGPAPTAISQHCAEHGRVDLVLCLFGVLSHIDTPEQRRHTLRQLREALDPEHGRLLISVPNRHRRFRREQRNCGNQADIRYVRDCGGEPLQLSYHLYDIATFRRELQDAGFNIDYMQAESLWPESVISNSRLMGRIDHALSRWLPTDLGYGLLAVARPVAPAGGS